MSTEKMLIEHPAIPKGAWILVTGANGYIASNTVDLLLEFGYNVRGTVRSEKPWLVSLFENKYGQGRFETCVLSSLEDEGVFDKVLNDVSGILHVASDVSLSPEPERVIPSVVAATKAILQAAAKHPSIKRFVLTSSSTAAVFPSLTEKIVVTEDTWNDAAVSGAWSKDTPPDQKPMVVYGASKTEGEREAWKWVKDNQPGFVLNTVLPNFNVGRILAPEIRGSTMSWVISVLKGDDTMVKAIPPQYYVNVQDTARLHVIALLEPSVQDERIFAFAGPVNWTSIIKILHRLRPQKDLPSPPESEGQDLCEIRPAKRAEELLKKYSERSGWTNLEDSLAEGITLFE